jgi:hypothetical protein
MSEDKLTRDDLVLLMESYRNMITMHQTILDQTTKTIQAMDVIATKQDSLFSKQGNICNTINSIDKKMDKCSLDCAAGLVTNTDRMDSFKDSIVKVLNGHEKKTIEEHAKLSNKIYIGWIGMGTIIIGLVGLIYTITNLIQTLHPPLP